MCRSEDETQLIARICGGEREGFRILVEAHQDRVYRVCLHLLCDRAGAEDLAQDTFVRAYQKLGQFDSSSGSFCVWLLTIARRLSINALKKNSPLPMAQPPEDTVSKATDRPDQHASQTDAFNALDDALTKLSGEHRRAFAFAEIEELTYEEIARIEGIAIGTVKSRVSRAKHMLQGLLQPIYQELKDTLR